VKKKGCCKISLNSAQIIGLIVKRKVAIDFELARQEPLKSVTDVTTLKKLVINSRDFIDLEVGFGN